jgi:hypothetical protein
VLSAFWESFGSTLGERSAASLLTPAVAFWTIGLLASETGGGPAAGWIDKLGGLGSTEQVIVSVALLIALGASAAAIRTFVEPTISLLEGYWPSPLRRLERRRRKRVCKQLAAAATEINNLSRAAESRAWTTEENRRVAALTRWRRGFPARADDAMPTRLGNVLRAAEDRPFDRYGLDAVVCWPRLWLVLPQDVRDEVAGARRALDTAVELLIWSCLTVVWVALAWWPPLVAVAGAAFSYRLAVRAAATYGDLLEATFDLHRSTLFEALDRPLAGSPSAQLEAGLELSEYLLRGPRLKSRGDPETNGAARSPADITGREAN